MTFDIANPDTWTPRESRSDAGTLLCICGKPGSDFIVDGVEEVGILTYGVLRGVCCQEHWDAYRGNAPQEQELAQFGPLFAYTDTL